MMDQEKPIWLQELDKVKQVPQTQEALNDQLKKLRIIANKFGLYDAADYLRNLNL
jgi:hypothetical protein